MSLVGGKAAGLAALMAARLPVPDGFAIPVGTTSEETIRAAYRELGGGPVAVRSSATAEDGGENSFAGEHDTYLWVVGEDAVIDAVHAAARASTPSVPSPTGTERGIADSRMAVVVQRMVDADAAGVAMTLNPANGDRCVVAIESAFGLGETVVGGTVTPDRFLVDKVMLDVVETQLADKHVELKPEGCARSSWTAG